MSLGKAGLGWRGKEREVEAEVLAMQVPETDKQSWVRRMG